MVIVFYFVQVNLALGRPCRASTGDDNAGRAVDGNKSPAFPHGGCTHTVTVTPIKPCWWGVELQIATYVRHVVIYNRGEGGKLKFILIN